jgi:general secretion pathway protein I
VIRSERAAAGGFTLLEILVALFVLAIALTATARSLGAATDTTAALRDRALARWVAEDQLTNLELQRAWPELDVKEGDADMGGRSFHWSQATTPTPVASMRRVEVSVLLPGTNSPLMRLSGFLELPAGTAQPGGTPPGTNLPGTTRP